VSVVWLGGGRLLIGPDTRSSDLRRSVADADVVQFSEPLPPAIRDALADALRRRPEVELYVYGHYGQTLDGDLGFLRGFEFIERLSLNLVGLTGVDGLARFTALRALILRVARKSVNVACLEQATALEKLALGQPMTGLEVLSQLQCLRELTFARHDPLSDEPHRARLDSTRDSAVRRPA
jgi:hypothetical protein